MPEPFPTFRENSKETLEPARCGRYEECDGAQAEARTLNYVMRNLEEERHIAREGYLVCCLEEKGELARYGRYGTCLYLWISWMSSQTQYNFLVVL